MASRTSEYKEEYCGQTGKRKSNAAGGVNLVLCSKSEDIQPVGGRCGYLYRLRQQEALKNALDRSSVVQTFTPYPPLPVPDVHKLRYMHNNYMTPDDWYAM